MKLKLTIFSKFGNDKRYNHIPKFSMPQTIIIKGGKKSWAKILKNKNIEFEVTLYVNLFVWVSDKLKYFCKNL